MSERTHPSAREKRWHVKRSARKAAHLACAEAIEHALFCVPPFQHIDEDVVKEMRKLSQQHRERGERP